MVMTILSFELNWLVVWVSMVAFLVGYILETDQELSLNEQMIEEGYAWSYDGGTKQKNFEELREIRITTWNFSMTPIFVFGFTILLTMGMEIGGNVKIRK